MIQTDRDREASILTDREREKEKEREKERARERERVSPALSVSQLYRSREIIMSEVFCPGSSLWNPLRVFGLRSLDFRWS